MNFINDNLFLAKKEAKKEESDDDDDMGFGLFD